MRHISIVTLLALVSSSSLFGADDLAGMFKEGKLDGRLRAQYFYTDWIKNDWGTKPDKDSKGLAVGGSLIYKTGQLKGLSGGVGFYTTSSLEDAFVDERQGNTSGNAKNTTGSDLFARGPGAATNYGDGYGVLAQAYLQYNFAHSEAKLGRFLMTNPFITPNDTKMIPIAVEGASATIKEIANTTIFLDYADKIKERGMTYFGNMADTGDTPDAIKNYYRTHYTATIDAKNTATPAKYALTGTSTSGGSTANYGYASGGDAPGVYMFGIKNKSLASLELQAWGMHWADIIDQAILEANYAIEAGPAVLSFGGRYMQQFDRGAGDIITPMSGSSVYSKLGVTNTAPAGSYALDINKKGDNNDKVDTHLLALRTALLYGPAKFMLAYSATDKGGDIIAPWRGFPTDGYTRSMTQTDWGANTKAYKGQLDYDLGILTKGLSTIVSYAYYDRDPSKVPYQGTTDRYYGNGDTHQWNVDLKYDVPSIKGLELKARGMYQSNQKLIALANQYGTGTATKSEGFGNDTSNRELRLEANYRF